MDDLLDLDFNKHSSPSSTKTTQSQYGQGKTAFDYLAKSSNPSLQPIPPTIKRTPSPATQLNRQNAKGGNDAFAELFGSSNTTKSNSNSSSSTQMSMADRLAKDRSSPSLAYQPMNPTSRSNSPALHPPLQRTQTPSPSLNTNRPTPIPSAPPSHSSSAWDFDLLTSTLPPSASKPSPTPPVPDPFDLTFDDTPPPTTLPSSSRPEEVESDFSLLGAFSQPARPRPSSSSSTRAPPPSTSTSRTSSLISPPPELLLKLTTELGFSLPAANAALLETQRRTGGFRLEDAVEILMNQDQDQGGGERGIGKGKERNRSEVDEWGDEELVKVGRRRSWEHESSEGDAEREREMEMDRRRRAAQPKKEELSNANGDGKGKTTEEGGEKDQSEVLREQAQEVFDRAQKIGFGLFKTANAYWGQGKEVLTKKIEEQRKMAGGSSSSRGGKEAEGNGGRPKWWKEGMDEIDREGKTNGKEKEKESGNGFKDSDDENEGPESVLPQRPSSRSKPPPPRQQHSQPAPPPAQAEYRSPFRRQKATPSPAPPPTSTDLFSSPAPAPAKPIPPSNTASRPSPTPHTSTPRPTRAPISIPPSTLSSALKHKESGNSHFKLGRYSDATASYLLALELLPSTWIGCVSILNNLALSRLKSGEEKLAIIDCTLALSILLSPSGGTIDLPSLVSESSTLRTEEREVGLGDLREQLGKLYSRRAKGYEAGEKWREALRDWEVLREKGDESVMRGAGGVKVVAEGIMRCRKALAPKVAQVGPTPRPTAPKPAVKKTVVEKPSAAVAALQANQASQLAEDDLRLSLKDSVDSRITAWKGGKETNLRALLASLDLVLWDELGWKKVGMAELISVGQVKVKYVRAIAKVHPDKLGAANSSVEQRMIAGAVFASLNEAWNAHKA